MRSDRREFAEATAIWNAKRSTVYRIARSRHADRSNGGHQGQCDADDQL